jgi:hypothetical protein
MMRVLCMLALCAACTSLDEFFASFPIRNVVVPIADGDYSPPFRWLAQILWSFLSLLCWDPPDSDPLTPGLQSECTFVR